MNEEYNDIPASLRRPKKEPEKAIQVRIAISHWKELTAFARDYDQDVSTFVREAIEDWLRRARKVRQTENIQRERRRRRTGAVCRNQWQKEALADCNF